MADWSNELVLYFLECYQEETIIWDPQHKNHKDKKKVNDAWERLTEKLNIPIKELKTKKDILMGTFRRHLKKKQDSIRSGAEADDIYEPVWFAYSLMESFLTPLYTARQTNTEQGTSIIVPFDGYGFITCMLNTKAPLPITYGTLIFDPSKGHDELSTIQTTDDETSDSQIIEALINKEQQFSSIVKRSRRHPTPATSENQMATAFSHLSNILSHRKSNIPTDECDLYSKLLATKLRQFPKDERQLIMYEIDGIFIKKIQNKLSASSSTSANCVKGEK